MTAIHELPLVEDTVLGRTSPPPPPRSHVNTYVSGVLAHDAFILQGLQTSPVGAVFHGQSALDLLGADLDSLTGCI
jgi:hypothetical protein